MKANLKRTIMVLILAIMFSGCTKNNSGNEENNRTTGPTTNNAIVTADSTTSVPTSTIEAAGTSTSPSSGSVTKEPTALSNTKEPEATPKTVTFYDLKTNVPEDIDGDGKKDTIYYETLEAPDPNINVSYGIKSLKINKKEFVKSVEGMNLYYENLEMKKFAIVDLDLTDKWKEIAILDFGPSDDISTTFLRYDGTKLVLVGQIYGVCVAEDGDFTINGDKKVGGSLRLSVLQTWFAPCYWKLNSAGKLIQETPKVFIPDTSYMDKVKTLVKINVYKSMSLSSSTFSVSKGTTLTFTETDNKNWVKLKTSDGKTGWIHLKEFNILDGANSIDAMEAFEGLCMAD